jgi:excisionase family DNA binding protein
VSDTDKLPPPPPPILALRPAETAHALGIGVRKLWSMTVAGEIPHLRLGKAILYPVAELQRWLSEQTRREVPRI